MSDLNPSSIFRYQREHTFPGHLWGIWLWFPTSLRGFLYRILLRYYRTSPEYPNSNSSPPPLSRRFPLGLYTKPCRTKDDALVAEYIRKNTTIPVPRVLDLIPNPNRNSTLPWLMITKGIPGKPAFIPGPGNTLRYATPEQHKVVHDVLTGWLNHLRSLQSPYGDRICSFSGGPFLSYRIGMDPVGPFNNAAEFHAQDFFHVWEEQGPDVKDLLRWRATHEYSIKLVHGDFLLHNIILDDDLRPCGLIDWECAAWAPSYYEKAVSGRAMFGTMWCWKAVVGECFPEFEQDMKLEHYVHLHYI